jgi:hypothetical protein
MEIRQDSIELPSKVILDRLTKPYFEKTFGSVLASFDPQTLLVDAMPPHAIHEPDGRVSSDAFLKTLEEGLETRTTEKERMEFLFRETNFLHEVSHFHDTACTAAGFQMFAREWTLVLSLYIQLQNMKRAGWAATDSLVDMYRKERNGEVRRLVDLYHSIMLYRICGYGDLEFIEVDDAASGFDVIWGATDIGGTSIRLPFFPATLVVDGRTRRFLVALGFRAITECRAVLHQWLIIRSFGQTYVDRYREMLGTHLEYRVVNMLFTRVLKRHGINPDAGEWASGELWRILSAVLARDSGSFDRPIGGVLLEEMARVDPKSGRYPGTHAENVRHMKNVRAGLPPSLTGGLQGQWHGYQMRDFALSCFRQAMDVYAAPQARDEPWPPDTLEWYAFFNWKLPQPPVSVRGREIQWLPALDLSDVATRARVVAATVLFRSLLEQAASKKSLVCPVLRGAYSTFLRQLQLHPHCDKGLHAGDCGRFGIGDDTTAHCDCPWKLMAVDVALARDNRGSTPRPITGMGI